MPERTILDPAPVAGRKMRSSKVVYPLDYNRRLQDFDNWDHMVFARMFGRQTVYDFPTPPEGVLDLGCGTGLWCIEAAKQWPRAAFIGVDIKKIQPDLAHSGQPDLSSRIKWVHTNFLNALPFASNVFDFVRIRYIGLAVPEDKWQDLLEEVHRVLKPGGLLEITEDDLTFPSGPPPFPVLTESTLLSTTSSADSTLGSSQTSLGTPVSGRPRDLLNLLIPNPSIGDLEAPTSPPSSSQWESKISPRDHRRIGDSWKDMLNHHFIAPPISILPFYLNSIFAQVAPQPPLQLNLPPNSSLSGLTRPLGPPDSPTGFHILDDPNEAIKSQGSLSVSYPLPESVAPLQLARQMHMIMACKDAIWDRYQALYSKSSTVSDVTISKKERNIKSNTARDEFEFHWDNWVNDMSDRIDIRSIAMAAFSLSSPPGNTPEYKVWRKRCGEIEHIDSDEPDHNMCRYIRTFLSWKASDRS